MFLYIWLVFVPLKSILLQKLIFFKIYTGIRCGVKIGKKLTVSNSTTAAVPQDQARILPKWQIVGSAASKPLQRPVASLKPGSAPQKATLLTQNGPVDVSTDTTKLRGYYIPYSHWFLPFGLSIYVEPR